MLPLCVFKHLYPNWISPAGLPTVLDHVSTRLTTCNGSHIPHIWCTTWPHHLVARWPWHFTPQGTLILVCHRHPWPCHPRSPRLAVVKMNCAITVAQPDTKPPSPAPAPTVTADMPFKSTDDLIKEFSDQFTGIGRFSGEYPFQIWHDVPPIIHALRKCPIALCPKVKEHLNKMEHMGVITCMDQPTDWVSSITYILKANGKLHLCLDPHDFNKAICCNHHKMPTVEEVASESVHS